MDQVQKTAIIETVKVVCGITAIVFVVSAAIALLSLQTIASLLLVYCLVMGVKMIYDINLAQAKVKQAEIDAEIDRLHK